MLMDTCSSNVGYLGVSQSTDTQLFEILAVLQNMLCTQSVIVHTHRRAHIESCPVEGPGFHSEGGSTELLDT